MSKRRSGLSQLAAVVASVVVVAATAFALPAGAAVTIGPVDSTIPDGDAGSLRDVLENDVADGDAVLLDAGASYVLTCGAGGDVNIIAAVTIQGDGATIEQTCDDNVLSSEFDLTLIGVTITGGDDESDGGGIDLDSEGADLTLIESQLIDNISTDDGGGADVGGTCTIIRSTIANNVADSDLGGGGDGGGLRCDAEVLFVNSTVTGNTSTDEGAIDTNTNAATLVYTTLVGNVQRDALAPSAATPGEAAEADPTDGVDASLVGDAANITAGTLTAFGTVIAAPIDGVNCEIDGTDSLGYNRADDDTCGLTDPTDDEALADPQLGELAFNGGPTQTMLPSTTSPLVDAIPLDACAGGDEAAGEEITTDQRNEPRPDPALVGCDVGAVELQPPPPPPPPPPAPSPTPAPLVVQPRFTG